MQDYPIMYCVIDNKLFRLIAVVVMLGAFLSACQTKPAVEPSTAASTFDARLAADKTDLDAKIGRALVYRIEGKSMEAQKLLLEVLTVNPKRWEAHAALGSLLLDNKRNDEARKAFVQAANLNSNAEEALAGLGRIYLLDGDFESAVTYLSRALALYDSPYTRADRAKAYAEMGSLAEAEKDYGTVIVAMPDDPFMYLDRGRLRARTKQYAAAVQDFNKVVSLMPDYTLAYFYRAQVQERQEKFKDAIKDYQLVLSKKASYNPALEALGGLYIRSGHWKEASLVLEKSYDSFLKNDYILVFSVAALMLSKEKELQKEGIVKAQAVVAKIQRDDILYQVLRSYVDSKLESQMLLEINNLPKGSDKARAQLLAAVALMRSGSKTGAEQLALEVGQFFEPESMEGRLAAVIMHGPIPDTKNDP